MTTLATARLGRRSSGQLDRLFRQSPAGPIPVGDTAGTALIAPGTPLGAILAPVIRRLAWQGKIFDPATRTLRNKLTPFGLRAIVAQVYPAPSWVDGRECLVLDYSRTSRLAHWIRDEIREVAPGQYLGVVFWGRRRLIHFALQVPAPQ